METVEERRARFTLNSRNYRSKHPDRIKTRRRNLYLNRKRRAMKMISDVFCEECGCNELDFLEINHIGGGGCQEWKERKCAIHDDILSGKRSVEGLNILCRVCNAIEFLNRKNPNPSGQFIIKWEAFTGQQAVLANIE